MVVIPSYVALLLTKKVVTNAPLSDSKDGNHTIPAAPNVLVFTVRVAFLRSVMVASAVPGMRTPCEHSGYSSDPA